MTIVLDTVHSVKWVIIERRDFVLKALGASELKPSAASADAKTGPLHLSEKGRLNPFHALSGLSHLSLQLLYLALPIPETMG
jgi:hypothetical protein